MKIRFYSEWRVCVLMSMLCLWIPGYAETLTQGAFSYQIESVPDWVRPVQIAGLAQAEKLDDASVRYLLADNQVNYLGKTVRCFSHYALMPVTEKGLEDVSEISINFSPEYQHLTLHSLVIHRKGERLNKLRAVEVKLIQREEDIEKRMYNGMVTAFVVLTDVRVGDVVEYSFSRVGSNPVFGEKQFDSFILGSSASIAQVAVRLLLPVGRTLHYRQHGFSEVPIDTVQGQAVERVWMRRNVPAIYDEGEYPRWYFPYAQLELSEYDNWQDVIAWALPLYQVDVSLSPAIMRQVHEWQKSAQSKAAYIEKALRFAQDEIRYFGVEYGQNSHKPSPPNEVFEKRYGDCKDKSLFLSSLLVANGIKAAPALVSAGTTRRVADMLPSPGVFDHVVVYAELDGKALWLDPTLTYQHGKLETLSTLGYQKALVISKAEKALKDIVQDVGVQAISVKHIYRIESYTKPIEYDIESILSGREAERVRQLAATEGVEKLDKYYFDYFSRFYPRLERRQMLSLEDDKGNNKIRLLQAYRIPDYIEEKQGQSVAELNGYYLAPYVKLPNTVKRAMPLGVYHPLRLGEAIEIHYPNSIDWDLDMASLVIEDGTIRYHRNIFAEGDTVRVTHTYETLDDHVPVASVPAYVANLKRISDALTYSLSIASQQKSPLSERERRLKKALKLLLDKNKNIDAQQ